ncbi:AAA family ATPase [Marinobacter salinisoli]|uniref:AAA family ATPase n=1 Tax=Marinobacter salinisoli TaxID=2769486 RepID=A0ABX7MTZ6_9GAMM|nr:AAA family ATPase [Marinobacter salinisoli]QSP95862.1 AAA family ATPase [Marinobacter salinisoli]
MSFNGRKIDLPASKKTRGLLGYLLARPVPRTRSELCDLLWEDAEDPRGALRWSLSKLRTTLGPTIIVANRNTVELNTNGISVDVAMIDAASGDIKSHTTEELTSLEALFRGEFLNDLELSDCYGFYEWCQSERSKYGRVHTHILETLVDRNRTHPGAALEYAHRLVGRNPFDESAHIRVVELLLSLGRQEEAAAQVAQCRKIFQLELGVEPSPALDMAGQALLTTTKQRIPEGERQESSKLSSEPLPAPKKFIGRATQIRLIRSAFSGHGPALALIVGTPGIGKSALLSEIAKGYGLRHLSACAIEVERSRPFGVWIDALRNLPPGASATKAQDTLRDRLLSGKDKPEALTEQWVFDSFRQLMTELAQEGPVLIALDDVQWIEPSSCALLSYLIRHFDDGRIHVCLAARAGEVDDNDAVQTLISGLGNNLHRITLTGLTGIEASALAQQLAPADKVPDIVAKAQGNPFYLIELARADRRGPAEATLRETLATRIERMSQPAANIASWASIFGRSIPADTVISASGMDLTSALEAIEELERHGVIESLETGSIEFTHDLVKNAVYERISNARRRLMHSRVAELLAWEMAEDPSQAARVLHQSTLSNQHLLAARAAVIAGQNALRSFANSEASDLARKGLFHAEKLGIGSDRISLAMSLLGIQVLATSGIARSTPSRLTTEIRSLISRASQQAMAEEVAQGEYLLSVLFQEMGDPEAAGLATTRAADAARQIEAQKKIRQLANSARCLLELGKDIAKAADLSRDADLLARQEGVADVEVAWSCGLLAYWQGNLDVAATNIECALDLARDVEDHWRESKCLTWAAKIALEQNRLDAAIGHATELGSLAAKIGEGSMAPLSCAFIAIAKQNAKGLSDAIEALKGADDKSHLAYILNFAADRLQKRGDASRAIDFARMAYRFADDVGNNNEKVFAQSLIALSESEIDSPATLEELEEWSSSPELTARVQRMAGAARKHRRQRRHDGGQSPNA